MPRADLIALGELSSGASPSDSNVIDAAISELTALRAALDAAEKRNEVLAKELRLLRPAFDAGVTWFNGTEMRGPKWDAMLRAFDNVGRAARLATDENGGLGT